MFSIKESLKYGWEKFKANMGLAIGATLLTFIVAFLGEIDRDGFILGLIAAILGVIIRIGFTKIFLRMSDGETPKFGDLFKQYKLFWRYLGTEILQGLVALGGLILLIIPGIIWAVRFSFAAMIMVDTNSRPVASMKESYAITKGKFWQLLGFFIVLGLLNILGFIALGIGLLVTVPVSTFAYIHVYRALTQAKAGITTEAPVSTV